VADKEFELRGHTSRNNKSFERKGLPPEYWPEVVSDYSKANTNSSAPRCPLQNSCLS